MHYSRHRLTASGSTLTTGTPRSLCSPIGQFVKKPKRVSFVHFSSVTLRALYALLQTFSYTISNSKVFNLLTKYYVAEFVKFAI